MMRSIRRLLLLAALAAPAWAGGAPAAPAPAPAPAAPAASAPVLGPDIKVPGISKAEAEAKREWADSNSYRLGPGDILDIYVYGEDDLKREKLRLSGSGIISYPFGDVRAVGLTASELERAIENGLKQGYLVNPRVSVIIEQYRPFFIYGQVKRPGAYPFQPGLNVRKAVSLAEGFTELADPDKIYIVRENDPKQQAHKIGLGGEVLPGDTVTVQESFF